MFTNSLGQVIVPGDRIVAFVQGYSHSIKIRDGIFVGLSPSGKPQYRTKMKVWGYWNKAGKDVGWAGKKLDPSVEPGHRDVDRVSTAYSGRVFKLA